jgi:hypothetical protein
MDKAPIFPMKGKKIKPSDFARHYHCPHYETCIDEAAKKDRHLDCGACEYRLYDLKEA